MIVSVLEQLDAWVAQENAGRKTAGMLTLARAYIRILGQTALLEAHIDLHLLATSDVDAKTNAEYVVQKKFDELLQKHGKHLDPMSHEVWMPKETEYEVIYKGKFVDGSLAKADYVLLSKALKAPGKNRALITEYLAKGPSKTFLKLAGQYNLNLEQFL